MISERDYERFWPAELTGRIFVGRWLSEWEGHYAETFFWRTQTIVDLFPDEAWIAKELNLKRPTLPAGS